MANVLNRSTKEFIVSANTVNYPVANWIHDPDMSAVDGFPSRYWTITGDTVSLMSQAERDAVDAALLVANRNVLADEIDQVESFMRAFALVLLDEFNDVSATLNSLLTAIDNANNLASLKTDVAAIADRPIRTAQQLKTAVRNRMDS